jgi:hypothetical protein
LRALPRGKSTTSGETATGTLIFEKLEQKTKKTHEKVAEEADAPLCRRSRADSRRDAWSKDVI